MLICLLVLLVSVTFNEAIFTDERWQTVQRNFEKYAHSTHKPFPETYADFGKSMSLKHRNSSKILLVDYDFIVVGSGSSGAVVASRLSEFFSWKILLLEAGNPGNFLTTVPLLAALFQLTPYNWNYTTEPQEGVCLGMVGQKCAWPRGKALGGSSVINYMLYTRGNPKDYEKWYNLGNDGWSYPDVLPYFKKSENCKLGKECSNGYHTQGGLWSVMYAFKSRITEAFVEAGVEMGGKIVDYNSEDFMGFSPFQANINRGRRHSVADAFLYPFVTRKNLKILTSARVTKVLLDDTGSAYGVEFQKRGKTYIARASKEVILSAGTFNSPQLLMLSGIGPREHLSELGIPTVRNLPVGQRLYDHIAYVGLAFKINETVEPPEAIFNPAETFKWVFSGTGVFTSLAGVEALGYINTGSIPDPKYPDIELIFAGVGSLESDFGLVVANELRIKREIYNAVFKSLELTPAYTIMPMLLHPKSRGYMKLNSKNPYDRPLFYGNYFSDPEGNDIKTLLAAVRYIQKMSQTTPFQRFGSRIHDTPIPGCEEFVFDSDEYWFCALRTLTVSLHHQIGTCKMGPNSDEEAVVDEKLKVHGISGLRVIDSSVIPVTLSAHTSAPAVMIGEKGADIIKQDWGVL